MEWTCPRCRNIFADDGTRVCTHDQFGRCDCPNMPDWLRRIREAILIRRELYSLGLRIRALENKEKNA